MSQPVTMTSPVLIRLLGGFRLSVAGREVTSLPRKAQALLAYLAIQDGRPVSRETVSDLLWTDRGARQAKASLRQNLLVTRQALRDAGAEVIDTPLRMVAFVPGIVETDVGRFRLLARASDRASLAEAAEVYAGTLLDRFPPVSGDFDDWLVTARAEVTDAAIDVLHRLTDACLAEGDVHPAVLAAERMLALDLLREDSHRLLMEVYLRAGRRADAIRQYEACVEVLRRELDVGPSEETTEVVRGIRAISGARREDSESPRYQAPGSGVRMFDGPPRIAVLPLISRGAEHVPEHLSDGLVEDVICQLAGLREISVISHGSTVRLRDGSASIQEIGSSLDARYAVRGTIRRSGPSIRITAELTDIATSQVIWARSYDGQVTLSFAEQDRIVSQIVHTLSPRIIETELHRIRGKRIDSLSVYEKVLLARSYLARLGGDNFVKAKLIMDEVLEHEPNWGEAYALAADCHGLLLAEGWSGTREHHIAEIDRLSNIALTLDSDNVRALTFYGHRKTIFHRDHDAAQAMFQRAVEVAPGSAQAWLWSSYTYSYTGQAADAVKRAERALHLSPSDREAYWFYLGLCIAYYTAQEYDTAVEWGRRALSEPAVGRTGRIWAAAAMAAAGRITEAHELARWILSNWPYRGV